MHCSFHRIEDFLMKTPYEEFNAFSSHFYGICGEKACVNFQDLAAIAMHGMHRIALSKVKSRIEALSMSAKMQRNAYTPLVGGFLSFLWNHIRTKREFCLDQAISFSKGIYRSMQNFPPHGAHLQRSFAAACVMFFVQVALEREDEQQGIYNLSKTIPSADTHLRAILQEILDIERKERRFTRIAHAFFPCD